MVELRFGYTLADLNGLARLAVHTAGAMAGDWHDRYDTAWSAIAEHLYAAPHWPPRHDLVRAGQLAIYAVVDGDRQAYGYYRRKTDGGHHEWERERVYAADKSARKQANATAHRRPDRTNAYVDDGYRQPRSVRVIEAPSVRYQKRHQDEKPVKVVAELVRECTPPGGTVLDPTAGVGTTGIAAAMSGRRAVLIEADERYCEAIAKRLQQDVLPILGGGVGV
jgi:hypothetical protein